MAKEPLCPSESSFLFDMLPGLAKVRHKDSLREDGPITYANRNNLPGPLLQEAIIRNFSAYAFEYTEEMRKGEVDVKGLFRVPSRPLRVEIGFGNGESTFADAKDNSSVNFLCFDVYLPGFARLMARASEAGLDNLILCHYDAVDFLRHSMPEGHVERFNVFFPDPWPKTRHKKRRIINPDNVALMSRCLEKGGAIHAATDIADYAMAMMRAFDGEKTLRNRFEGFAPTGMERNATSYERKAVREGRRVFDMFFVKK